MDSRAVLLVDGTAVYSLEPRRFGTVVDPALLSSAAMVYHLALRLDARAVWLRGVDTAAPGWWAVRKPLDIAPGKPQGANHWTVARVKPHYQADDRRAVMVHDLDGDTRWPWGKESDPFALLCAIASFERAAGPCSYHPAAMALWLLINCNRKHPEWLNYPEHDRLIVPRSPAPRMLNVAAAPERPAGYYVHSYDVNSSYLAVAGSTSFGCGGLREERRPLTLDAGETLNEPDLRAPAVFHVKRYAANVNRGVVIDAPGWYDVGTVRAALYAGQSLYVDRRILWQEHHASFRAWAETIWSYRMATNGIARDAVKAMYRAGLGRFAAAPQPGRDATWYRPLWYHAVISEASRRLWARAVIEPAAFLLHNTDGIAYLARRPTFHPSEPDTLGALTHRSTFALSWRLLEEWRRGNYRAVSALVQKAEEAQ